MSTISTSRCATARPASGKVLPGEFLLRDGTPALIWPLLPTDAETLREGFRRLSSESRQQRFLGVIGQLDDSMIRRLVDSVDGVHHIALLLIVVPPEGEEGPAGVARLLQYPDDPATADIAVTVVDDWQGRGAGTALVSALLQRRPAAVTRLRTIVEAGNRASLALLAGAGRVSSGLPERGVLDVTVELPAARRARSAVEKVTDFWTQAARKWTGQTYLLPWLPRAGPIPAVERYFELVQRMAEMNRDLTVRCADAASALSAAGHEQVPAGSAGDAMREQAGTAEQAAREQAEQAKPPLPDAADRGGRRQPRHLRSERT